LIFKSPQDRKIGDRALPLRPHPDPLPAERIAAEGELDQPLVLRDQSVDQGEITLPHLPPLELLHQAPVGLFSLGDDEDPARLAIEALDDPRP